MLRWRRNRATRPSSSDAVATILGSIAAACECEVDGNVPVTPGDVRSKIDAVERQANYSDQNKP